ncbi:hypothetical protein [Flavobacterium sp. ACAM 123]|jgi:hypothetical protein|nr:hypothetical protein [Flavobacterium sp. ACAM 123]
MICTKKIIYIFEENAAFDSDALLNSWSTVAIYVAITDRLTLTINTLR